MTLLEAPSLPVFTLQHAYARATSFSKSGQQENQVTRNGNGNSRKNCMPHWQKRDKCSLWSHSQKSPGLTQTSWWSFAWTKEHNDGLWVSPTIWSCGHSSRHSLSWIDIGIRIISVHMPTLTKHWYCNCSLLTSPMILGDSGTRQIPAVKEKSLSWVTLWKMHCYIQWLQKALLRWKISCYSQNSGPEDITAFTKTN